MAAGARSEIEQRIDPLVRELRADLAKVPLLPLLVEYQTRIDCASSRNRTELPDGFIRKWRYLRAMALCQAARMRSTDQTDFSGQRLDEITEAIYDVYPATTLRAPGTSPPSRQEFLTRLGFAAQARQLDPVAFPEQVRDLAVRFLEPFDTAYFIPRFAVPVRGIFAWVDRLVAIVQARLDTAVSELAAIQAEIESLHRAYLSGQKTIDECRRHAAGLALGGRVKRNSQELAGLHILSRRDVSDDLGAEAAERLTALVSCLPGSLSSSFTYPHEPNPLDHVIFADLGEGQLFFLDPSLAYQVLWNTLERNLLQNGTHTDDYYRWRARSAEQCVCDWLQRMFPSADICPNYYLARGGTERDVFLRDGRLALVVECKNYRVREHRGGVSDLSRLEDDFDKSVQHAYKQGLDVRGRLSGSGLVQFWRANGSKYFSIEPGGVDDPLLMCVTLSQLWSFASDLSLLLRKNETDPYPLALSLYELDTISEAFSGTQFVEYLRWRQGLHGNVHGNDELNFAGFFFKYGARELEPNTMLGDDFGTVFDRRWYRKQGLDIPEPEGGPAIAEIRRTGSRAEYRVGDQRGSFDISPQAIEHLTGFPMVRVKGRERNAPCPCGSGKKAKKCHGVM